MKELKKIDILSTGRIYAIIMGISSLLLSIVAIIASFFIPTEETMTALIYGGIQTIVIGIIMGFLGGIIGAYLYNIIAKKVGGIKLKLD